MEKSGNNFCQPKETINTVPKWQIQVPIKDNFKHKNPFEKLQSKIATAIILSFFGNRIRVCHLNQRLSHTSRAYIVQQEGLRGFVKFAERQKRMSIVFIGAAVAKDLNDFTVIKNRLWKDEKVSLMSWNYRQSSQYVSIV